MPVYYPPATSSSSSGPIITYGIDSRTLNATYGDHFTGGSLDAKWTRRNLTSGNESYAAWGGTYLINNAYGGTIGQSYYQTTPSGDFEVVVKIVWSDSGNSPIGPFIVDSSGAGYLCAQQNDNTWYTWTLSNWLHTAAANAITLGMLTAAARNGDRPIWMAIRKSGTNYQSRVSINGVTWSAYNTAISNALTPAFIGVGIVSSNSIGFLALDWFDVI